MTTKNLLLTQTSKHKDNCPICGKSLYLNSKISKRVGILNEFDEVEAWACPYCDSQFTLKNKPPVLYGTMDVEGEA